MIRLLPTTALTCAWITASYAADVTEADLLAAAQSLGQQYDTNYNAKNAAGMAGLYVADGALVSSGPVVRGQDALKTYYQSRFDAGGADHLTKIAEVHVQGDGGFGIGQFQVSVPTPEGGRREIEGNLGVVYQRAADGWHLRMVMASVPPPPK
jgi:ketosteroid isomerase-like protein